jgi:hypothetical protein
VSPPRVEELLDPLCVKAVVIVEPRDELALRARARLRARGAPSDRSLRNTRKRESAALARRKYSCVPSVEPSSTTQSSSSRCVCASTDSTARRNSATRFFVGT